MITIDKLNAYGADTKEGLARCMGMEDFYINLVNMQLDDENFGRLEAALAAGDAAEAFEAAHALKGALGNLALTPLAEPASGITERLRNADAVPDLSDILPAYEKALEELRAMR